MDSLSGFTVFVRVAETRSIVGAARTLGVSASAVGKRVARLEEKLGVRLFHRSTRSITLTAEGSLFLERSRRILAEIEATELELSQSRETPRGRLRVSLPLVSGLVLPTLADFMQAYPDIELDLDFSDRVVDVVDEGFDVVLRTGQPVDSRLSMRELGEFQLKLVGSPAYFARHGTPRCPEDLLRHTCLHYRFPNTGRLGMAAAPRGRRSPATDPGVDGLQQHRDPRLLRPARPGHRLPAGLRSARRCAKGAWSASSTPSASAARGSSCSGRPAARSRPSCAPSSTSSRHG